MIIKRLTALSGRASILFVKNMRLEKGHIIKTSYDTGPYRVIGITRGCTCPHILDEINNFSDPQPPSEPHMHLWLKGLEGHNKDKNFYMNWYREDTLECIKSKDKIIICENLEPVQQTLALV